MGIVLPLAVTDNDFCRDTAVPIFREHAMSSSKNSNGTITLKSFSELANALDLESLPPGPPGVDDQIVAAADTLVISTTAAAESDAVGQSAPSASAQLDVAGLIARLAAV